MQRKMMIRTIQVIAIFIIWTLVFGNAIAAEVTLKDAIAERIAKSGKVKLDLFVMSQCPFGVKAEQVIIPLVKEFNGRVDFSLYFIAEEMPDGSFRSLHGQLEVEEDIRQAVMAKYYPDKYLDYLLCRADNYTAPAWEQCAESLGIDVAKIAVVATSEEGKHIFRENIKVGNELRIFASPTILLDGEKYLGRIFPSSGNVGGCEAQREVTLEGAIAGRTAQSGEVELGCPISPPGVASRDAGCRGACGPGCPSTCTGLPDISICGTETLVCKYTGVIECGTHEGCKKHDARYDACAEGIPLCSCPFSLNPLCNTCCRICDSMCILEYGPIDCASWMLGGGPFDGYLTFADAPISIPCGESTPYCVDGKCVECRADADCDDDNLCTTEWQLCQYT